MTPSTVSVLIPTLDEEAAIGECLRRILQQTRAADEVIVADGGSTDRTRPIVEAIRCADPRVVLIDNPGRIQSTGLNRAFAMARGDVLVRLDARSFVETDYLERCVTLLDATDAAVVGGRMVARAGTHLVACGIAVANGAWWGAGPARFHGSGGAGPTDTVYLGAFRRSWLERVGGWAEDVGTNEDFELNHRIRRIGGTVSFDPAIEVGYQPRSTYRALARQYFRYGRSKAIVFRRHPSSIKPRQLAPLGLPLAVLAATRKRKGVIGRVARLGLGAYPAAVVALAARGPGRVPTRVVAAGAAIVMHCTWATGAIVGGLRQFRPRGARRQGRQP